LNGEDQRTPPEEERDLALGRFMDAWSMLEAEIRNLLRLLSRAPDQAAFAIAAAIPDMRRMNELLVALGELHLGSDDQAELAKICKELLISNKYRNSIVHGQWGCTNNRDSKPVGGIVYPFMWVRFYTFINKTDEFEAVLGRNKGAQKQYVFSVERLEERAQKARDFRDQISAFSERIAGRAGSNQDGS
jgi:hypothetical protein